MWRIGLIAAAILSGLILFSYCSRFHIIFSSAHAEPIPTMYGFKGMDCRFDQKAFEEYAESHGYAPITLKSCSSAGEAQEVIKLAQGRSYSVYGYSLGVVGINEAIRKGLRPDEVVTIGGYWKASFYDAINKNTPVGKWHNYPDASSVSPNHTNNIEVPWGDGFYLKGDHYKLQREVNCKIGLACD